MSDRTPGVIASTMLSPGSIVKGWINFSGQGTVTIRESFNVESLTDNAQGNYTITWSRPFRASSYCLCGSARNNNTTGDTAFSFITIDTTEDTGLQVGSARIKMSDHAGLQQDPEVVCILAIGDA